MANFYNKTMENMAKADVDFDVDAMWMLPIITASNFDATHASISDVLAGGNSRAGIAVDTQLSGVVVTAVAGGVDLQADKGVFLAPAGGETLIAIVIFDEAGGTDATRIPVAFFALSPTIATNGLDIEIRWDGVDGVGNFAEIRNAP